MRPFKKYSVITLLVASATLLYGTLNGQNLKEHRWEHRVVLIHTTDISSEIYQEQLREFQDTQEELRDRKLIVYQFVGDNYKQYSTVTDKSDGEWKPLKEKYQRHLGAGETFKVTLIGLDGGVKLERAQVLKKNELFRIIDAMPMRLSEMRNRNN